MLFVVECLSQEQENHHGSDPDPDTRRADVMRPPDAPDVTAQWFSSTSGDVTRQNLELVGWLVELLNISARFAVTRLDVSSGTRVLEQPCDPESSDTSCLTCGAQSSSSAGLLPEMNPGPGLVSF